MSDVLVDNEFFYNTSLSFVKYFSWLTKLVIFFFIIGIFANKPETFLLVNFTVKVLLGLFLIYRFNKYRKEKITLTELDRKVCYSAGLYILIISFLDVIQNYVDQIRNFIQPYTLPIIGKIKSFL